MLNIFIGELRRFSVRLNITDRRGHKSKQDILRMLTGSSGILLVGRVLSLFGGFGLSLVLVRRFGLDAMGTYTSAMPLITVLALVSALGLPSTLPREDLTDKERATAALFGWLAVLPFAVPLIVVYAILMGHNATESLTICAFAAAGPFFAIINLLTTLLVMARRVVWSLAPPVSLMIGIALAAAFARDILDVAFIVLAVRLVGTCWMLPGLTFGRIRIPTLLSVLKQGIRYVHLDGVPMLQDQGVIALMSLILSREQLGLLGLCRQVLNAAETPVWSYLQAHYPTMVSSKLANARSLESTILALAAVSMIGSMLLGAVLSLWVYRQTDLIFLIGIMVLAIPSRYLLNLFALVPRAVGELNIATRLTMLTFVFSIVVYPVVAFFWQIWGVFIFFVLLHALFAILWAANVRKLYPTLSLGSP